MRTLFGNIAAVLMVVLVGFAIALTVVNAPRVLWPVLLAVGAILFLWQRHTRRAMTRAFHHKFGSERDLLIVYTSSPHWQTYIEQQWASRWGARAVLFNRSLPWQAEQIEAKLWESMQWNREHTPLAIVVPKNGRLRSIELFSAFRDAKHGRGTRLAAAESRIQHALDNALR